METLHSAMAANRWDDAATVLAAAPLAEDVRLAALRSLVADYRAIHDLMSQLTTQTFTYLNQKAAP